MVLYLYFKWSDSVDSVCVTVSNPFRYVSIVSMLLAIWYDLLQHMCTGWHYKTLGQQLWEQPPTQGSLAKLLSDVTQQCHHKPTLHKLSPYTLPTMARPNTTHHHHNLATAPSYRTSYATGQRHFLTFCCTIKVSPLPASKWQQHYLQQCWATN